MTEAPPPESAIVQPQLAVSGPATIWVLPSEEARLLLIGQAALAIQVRQVILNEIIAMLLDVGCGALEDGWHWTYPPMMTGVGVR
jgi:hypothetical protein